MLNVASTGMFTILALIVNLKWYACTKIAQRIFIYSYIQYTSLIQIKYWTVWYIECNSMSTYPGVTNF